MVGRTSVYDLQSQKGRRKWLQLHVESGYEAAAAVEANIVILSCEPDHTLETIRTAAPTAFVSAGMPHGSVSSAQEAVREGFRILERGADAVYCSHSPFFIEAMAREGIPVTGHVGLVPNRATWTNFRAIGKTPEEAMTVFRSAKDLENAGCAFLEVEVVPVELADFITRNTHMITMGMGCGTACDTQYLFSCDVLGDHEGHYPRHSKKYADFVRHKVELQAKRVEAFKAFRDDVDSQNYPQSEHEAHMENAAFEKFCSLAQSL